jgi:hypothetical protein
MRSINGKVVSFDAATGRRRHDPGHQRDERPRSTGGPSCRPRYAVCDLDLLAHVRAKTPFWAPLALWESFPPAPAPPRRAHDEFAPACGSSSRVRDSRALPLGGTLCEWAKLLNEFSMCCGQAASGSPAQGSVLRPPYLPDGTIGSTIAHSASVRSLW